MLPALLAALWSVNGCGALVHVTPTSRRAAADQLYSVLAEAWRDKRLALVEDQASTLIDVIVASEDACDFDAAKLGGGLWLSLFTRGPTPRWLRLARLFSGLLENRVGQAYEPSEAAVRNYGEVVRSACYFEATGSFTVPPDAKRCPVDVDVHIAAGGVVVLGRPVDLGISGPGLLRVLHLDDNIRIFESPTDSPGKWEQSGLVVVQVRETALVRDDAGGRAGV